MGKILLPYLAFEYAVRCELEADGSNAELDLDGLSAVKDGHDQLLVLVKQSVVQVAHLILTGGRRLRQAA